MNTWNGPKHKRHYQLLVPRPDTSSTALSFARHPNPPPLKTLWSIDRRFSSLRPVYLNASVPLVKRISSLLFRFSWLFLLALTWHLCGGVDGEKSCKNVEFLTLPLLAIFLLSMLPLIIKSQYKTPTFLYFDEDDFDARKLFITFPALFYKVAREGGSFTSSEGSIASEQEFGCVVS